MFSSSEKTPLKSSTDAKAQKALADLSDSLGSSDVENPYMRKHAPASRAASLQDRVVKELKTNWWLWGSVLFAVLLIGSLVVFRESLYDSAKHGLPFLAVKENAAEACATQCKEEQHIAMIKEDASDDEVKLKEAYDTCYAKCVAQETKDVAEEREKFKKTEEEFEKMVEEKEKEAEVTANEGR